MRMQRTPGALAIRVCMALIALAALWIPGVTYADGGAPNLAYVAGTGQHADQVTVVDIATRRVSTRIAVGAGATSLLLSPDARYLYVTREPTDDVAVVDAHSGHVVAAIACGRAPVAMAIDLSGTGDAYVADSGDGTLSVLDLAARRRVGSIKVGARPMGVAVAGPESGIADPTSSEVYVANAGDNSVTILNGRTHAALATVPVPGGPSSIVIPATGGVAYVATQSGAIYAISLGGHILLGKLLQLRGPGPDQMDYDAITGDVYVPDADASEVDVLRPASAGAGGPATLPAEPARTLAVAGAPAAVAITFDGAYGFVASRNDGSVVMFDAPTHRALATLVVGGHPGSIITGAYPPALGQQAAVIAGIALYATLGLGFVLVLGFVLGWHRRLAAALLAPSDARAQRTRT